MTILLALYIGAGLLLSALSIPLIRGKIPPNGLYGFRIRQTMENPELWYPVNTYAGWRLLVTGLVTVISALGLFFIPGISIDTYALGCLAIFALVIGFSIVQIVAYLNKLSRRS